MPRHQLLNVWPFSARSYGNDKSSEKYTVLLAAFKRCSHKFCTRLVFLSNDYLPTYTASRSARNAQSIIDKL